MANIKSARKRARQTEKKRLVNVARKSDLKTFTKKVLAAVEDNNAELARELFKVTESKIARAKGKGLLKGNTASRKISRLAKKVARLEGQASA
ncbi:MAG: 30S ribosomal protein S20 [Epsilonproteobacteria bacterium]|nr:30S ribosomal protein S20 [Campylobacterota bacterium]